jgi:hypothetical protein
MANDADASIKLTIDNDEAGNSLRSFAGAFQGMGRSVQATLQQVASDTGRTQTQVAMHFAKIGQAANDAQVDVSQLREEMSTPVKVDTAWQSDIQAATNKAESETAATFDRIKSTVSVTAIAIGAAFTVVGLGAIYAVGKAVAATAGFMAGLVTGSSYKSEDIDKLLKANTAVAGLREQMNLTREEASVMLVAFDALHIKQEDYLKSVHQLGQGFHDNGEIWAEWGVEFQNTGNDLEDFQENGERVLSLLEQFAVGMDRDAMAAELGVPKYADLSSALQLNAESFEQAREEARAYGLLISDDVAGEIANYKEQLDEFNHNSKLTWDGVSRAISDGLMPILADLASFFKDGFPSAVNFTRGVVGAAVTLFHGFTMSIYALSESILAVVKAAGDGVAGLARAIGRAMVGDFGGAWEAIKAGGDAAKARFDESAENIVERARTTSARIRMAFLGGMEGEAATTSDDGPGLKHIKDAEVEKEKAQSAGAAARERSRFAAWEAELTQEKIAHELMNAENKTFVEFSKEREREFWQHKSRITSNGTDDILQALSRYAKSEMEINRKRYDFQQAELKARMEAERNDYQAREMLAEMALEKTRIAAGQESALYQNQLRELLAMKREHVEKLREIERLRAENDAADRLAQVEATTRAAELEVQLGARTLMDLLHIRRQALDERYRIESEAQEREIALRTQGTVEYEQELKKRNELRRRYEADKQSADGAIKVEENKPMQGVFGAVNSTIALATNTMLGGQRNAAQQFLQIWRNALTQWAVQVVGEMVKRWVMGEVLKTQATTAGAAARTAANSMEASTGMAIGGEMSFKSIMNSAAETFGAVYKSLAAIPVVGPVLAPVAAGAAFALVAGMAGKIFSAEGGFDVPKFANPVTQLHKEEMVLPAAQANVIRDLAESGGGAGGGFVFAPRVTALDTRGAERMLRRLGREMAGEMYNQARNFNKGRR